MDTAVEPIFELDEDDLFQDSRPSKDLFWAWNVYNAKIMLFLEDQDASVGCWEKFNLISSSSCVNFDKSLDTF